MASSTVKRWWRDNCKASLGIKVSESKVAKFLEWLALNQCTILKHAVDQTQSVYTYVKFLVNTMSSISWSLKLSWCSTVGHVTFPEQPVLHPCIRAALHISGMIFASPLPTITRNCNVYVEAIIIMSGSVLRTCCEFRIISPIVKQLQTSGKKQWSTLGFAQLRCSFEACHYSRTCEINRKLSHRKSRLSICSDTYNLVVSCPHPFRKGCGHETNNLAVQFMSDLS